MSEKYTIRHRIFGDDYLEDEKGNEIELEKPLFGDPHYKIDGKEVYPKEGGQKLEERTILGGGILMFALLLALTGCTSVWVMETSDKTHPPTDPNAVRVYLSKRPTGNYEDLGRVTIGKYTDIPPGLVRSGYRILKSMRVRAALMGGDAIIDVTEDFASTSGTVIKLMPDGR